MNFIITNELKIDSSKHKLFRVLCPLCGAEKWIRKSNLNKIKQCNACKNLGNDIYAVIKDRTIIDPISGCHLWNSYTSKDGYAVLKFKKKRYRIARLLLEKKLGRKIISNKETCHKCNNRLCINPDHLYEGTHIENGADMSLVGSVSGEKCGTSKITQEIAEEIKKLLKTGMYPLAVSKKIGVPFSIVKNIKYKRYWGF